MNESIINRIIIKLNSKLTNGLENWHYVTTDKHIAGYTYNCKRKQIYRELPSKSIDCVFIQLPTRLIKQLAEHLKI